MSIRTSSYAAICAVTLLACGSANAAEPVTGFYVGGNAGQSRANINTGGISAAVLSTGLVAAAGTTADETDTGFKLFGGYRFHPNFAVEAGYFKLGTFGFTTATVGPAATVAGSAENSSGFNIDLVVIAPINEAFSLFGRVGAQTSKTTISLAGVGAGGAAAISSSQTGSNYKAGVGMQYDFAKIGLRAEWERYRIPGGSSGSSNADVDLFSLGVLYRF